MDIHKYALHTKTVALGETGGHSYKYRAVRKHTSINIKINQCHLLFNRCKDVRQRKQIIVPNITHISIL
jgi:hypothetical protein